MKTAEIFNGLEVEAINGDPIAEHILDKHLCFRLQREANAHAKASLHPSSPMKISKQDNEEEIEQNIST